MVKKKSDCGLCREGVPIVHCANHDFPQHIVDLKPGFLVGSYCSEVCCLGDRKAMKRLVVICIDSEIFKKGRA